MRTSVVSILCVAPILVTAVSPPAMAKLTIVTTTQDPAALTRAIGGERVEVAALAKGYQDPHFLDAKPSYMVLLHGADLVEVIGLDLEVGYIGPIVSGARNENILPGRPGFLDLSQYIKPLEVVAMADRSQGDIHPNGNPHYWLDPENARQMARGIALKLAELDPAGKEVFARNLEAFESDLTIKEASWKVRLAPIAGQSIVTLHRSWSYFAARYGLQVVAFVEPKPGIPPTPTHTLELIKEMQAKQVKLLLMENFYDKRAPELVAAKTGAKLAIVPNSVGGEEGVATYFDLMERIVGTIEKAARS